MLANRGNKPEKDNNTCSRCCYNSDQAKFSSSLNSFCSTMQKLLVYRIQLLVPRWRYSAYCRELNLGMVELTTWDAEHPGTNGGSIGLYYPTDTAKRLPLEQSDCMNQTHSIFS